MGVGRPYAYGLALEGSNSIIHVLRSLLAEADLIMAVDGYPAIKDLRVDGAIAASQLHRPASVAVRSASAVIACCGAVATPAACGPVRQEQARGDDGRPRLYGGPMASVKQIQVTFDCAEPERVARFWCEVLGYVVPPPPEGFATWDDFDRALPPEHQGSAFACIDPSGAGPRLFFQRVPEGKVVKNRLHLDVRVGTGLVGEERLAALEAECARLVRSARYACDYCLPMTATSRVS